MGLLEKDDRPILFFALNIYVYQAWLFSVNIM